MVLKYGVFDVLVIYLLKLRQIVTNIYLLYDSLLL